MIDITPRDSNYPSQAMTDDGQIYNRQASRDMSDVDGKQFTSTTTIKFELKDIRVLNSRKSHEYLCEE